MLGKRLDLALGRDDSNLFLPWILALKVYLAALALAGLIAVEGAVERWRDGAYALVTVQLPANTGAAAVNAAVDVMLRTPGVAAARPLSADEIAALLEPWLGAGNVGDELPLPHLIDVTKQDRAEVDWADAARRLEARIPGAVIDTGMAWIEELSGLARVLQGVAAAILGLAVLVAVAAVVLTARAGLSIHRAAIELLHLLGAEDRYIARQFQRHILAIALRGGLLGAGLAAGTIAVVAFAAARLDAPLLPALSLGVAGWVAVAATPLAMAAIAVIAVRRVVLRTLARMT